MLCLIGTRTLDRSRSAGRSSFGVPPPKGVLPTTAQIAQLQPAFPKLTTFAVSSGADPRYNCVAWTIGRIDAWIWPPRRETGARALSLLDEFYDRRGWHRQEFEPEGGTPAIALYCASGTPNHVALAIGSGWWESKLGRGMRIVHLLLDLECPTYGEVHSFYVRKKVQL